MMVMMFRQRRWFDLHAEELHEFCQHMSNTRRMNDFNFSFNIALTINAAKSLTATQKVQKIIWCYSMSCLSLCLDQPSYIKINDRKAEGLIYSQISTF